MNGLDQIKARIAADAQAQADGLLAEAKAQAQAIRADYDRQAQALAQTILEKGERDAAEQVRHMENMAALEGRKQILATKQEMLSLAFDKALEQLLSLPEETYVDLLSDLCVKAAVTGREEVLFSKADRDKVGKKVVARANEKLAKQVAPKLPDELTGSAAGAILDKVVTAGSALLAGTGQLTVSEQTRPIRGGFILAGEGVEVNCAFETLVRLSRAGLEQEVAAILFDGP